MDRHDNESLHEKASEHYLQGEYGTALELWRTLRTQAPEDERAAEGIRLCEMMSDSQPPPEENAVSDIDLTMEDPEDEPGFDLPDPILEDMPASQQPETNPAHEDAVEQVLLNLDQLPEGSGDPATEPESRLDAAAAAELVKRQGQLLEDARAARDESRLEDATGILARLFILDEEHGEGRALEAEILEQSSKAAYEVEDKIAEAVQWMETGRLEDAEANLRTVLDISPGHQEAEHYLEQVLQRMEDVGQDGQDVVSAEEQPEEQLGDSNMDHGAVHLDTGAAEEIGLGGTVPGVEPSDELPDDEPVQEMEFEDLGEKDGATPARSSGLLRSRNLILAAVFLVTAAAGWYFSRGLFGGDTTPVEDPASSALAEAGSRGADPLTERSTEELIQQADALSRGAGEVSKSAAEQIPGLAQEAERQMDEADYASAVISWNQILELDPGHAGARRGIEEAGRRYREWQSRSADLVRAGYVFEEGDYSSALKILYRLPDDIQPEKVLVHKVNGWYNLAVISLKAGRIDQALERFGEIDLLGVEDQDAAELEAFAQRYEGREKDRTFYQDVNDLTFRSFDGN